MFGNRFRDVRWRNRDSSKGKGVQRLNGEWEIRASAFQTPQPSGDAADGPESAPPPSGATGLVSRYLEVVDGRENGHREGVLDFQNVQFFEPGRRQALDRGVRQVPANRRART